jgi:aromatic-L-amino-acid decarboxylase
MTPEEFRRHGHTLIDWLADHQERLAALPVQPATGPGEVRSMIPPSPPDAPEPFEAVIADLDRVVAPNLTWWQHPRFFGFFPSNALGAGVLGDLASTGLGVLGLSWQASPALTEIEEVAVDGFRQMAGLSEAWTGAIQDTASTSTLVALICARERSTDYALAGAGMQGKGPPLIVYASAGSHSSVEKAALLAGFGRDHVRMVPLDEERAMRPEALEETIEADLAAGLRPCAIVAAVGGTATTSIDPVGAIADVARRHGLWLHVDAAMAGSAMILPECRWMWEGIEGADSLVVNAHKWLGAPFDCALHYVRDEAHLIRVMSTNPTYLRSAVDSQVRNLRDTGIPLGRRFRALKLWFLIREQGVSALQARLRRDMENARWLADVVAATPGWRIVAPVPLQTVCLRFEPAGLEGDALDSFTREWADSLNRSGEAFVTPAAIESGWMVRVSIGAPGTERSDVEALWAAMQREAQAALERPTVSAAACR